MTDSAPIYDNKAQVRGQLDLRNAEWMHSPAPEPEDGHVQYAFIEHTDGATYVAMRNSKKPKPVLTFTMAEWDAFLAGAKDGEFDGPWEE